MRALEAASGGAVEVGSALRRALAGPTLRDHFTASYFSLRVGMIVVAVGIPIYLALGGRFLWGLAIQDSLSAYYHADGGALRDEFVGGLVAVGVFLILYKGFTRYENAALNVAGFAVIGVAFVPMAWQCGGACSRASDFHGLFAYTFFAFIFYVAFFRSSDTLTPELLPDPATRTRYHRIYRGVSIAMAGAILLAGAIAFFAHRQQIVIVLESVGVWAFAAYWIVKSDEMRRSDAGKWLAEGRLAPGASGRRELFQQSPVEVVP
ncbi:MAG: hypothetical protein AB7I38_05075 [Dehalococcoidia bacterium]